MQTDSSPFSRFLIVMAAFVIIVAGMRAAEAILVPFLLSLFIAIIVNPFLSWLKSLGIPGWLSVVLVMSMIVVVGFFIGAIVGSSINSFRGDLPQYQARLSQLSNGFLLWLTGLGISIDASQWQGIFNPSSALAVAGNTLGAFGSIMTNSFLILLTVVFILGEEINFSHKLRNAAPSGEKTVAAVNSFTKSVNKYMAMKTLVSLMTGLIVLISLWLVGVDYPVLWGLLAFLLNFIPNFGSILAAIPPVLLAVVQLGVPSALITSVIFLIVNTVIGNFIEPRIMGKGLNLSSLVVFLSLVFWGWVLGPVGMLLSVPLTMTVKIALESFEETYWMGVMLGASPGDKKVSSAVGDSVSI